MKRLLFLIFLLMGSAQAFSTHIVGGELNYRCLGNDLYEIKLTVYRDCYNGVPFFDNPAAIGIFDVNNVLVDTLMVHVRNNDTLQNTLPDPCLYITDPVCYHTTTYVDTIMLPFKPGGYQLVYQRCCRNITINNLIDPNSVGMTCYTFISEEALLGCNSNPVFYYWPPPLICNNRPLDFDHSAYDIDGDSIVYELCAPLSGVTAPNPMPQPPNAPPYPTVPWLAPYNVNDMLGGSPPLNINPVTGQLLGTPNTLGQFVVGVCAKEYRNGQLISVTRRDFQYNVFNCSQTVVAAFFTPAPVCDINLAVQFDNQSTGNANDFHWDFGVDGVTNDTSNLQEPMFIYPDTGTYLVTLISGIGTCSDTIEQTVRVLWDSLDTYFDLQVDQCGDSMIVQLTDLSTDGLGQIIDWNWDFGNGDTSDLQNPVIVYNQSGFYTLSLQIESSTGCKDSLSVFLMFELPQLQSPDTVAICSGVQDSIQLNPFGSPTLQYVWSPIDGLSDPYAPSPMASPLTTTTYDVTITSVINNVGPCEQVKQVTVVVQPPVVVDAPSDTALCSGLQNVEVYSPTAAFYTWYANPQMTDSIGYGNPFYYDFQQNATLYLLAVDSFGCFARDTVTVTISPSPVRPNFSFLPTGCSDSLRVAFQDLTIDTAGYAITQWQWDFGNGATAIVQNPVVGYQDNGSYTVSLLVTDSEGCTGLFLDTVVVDLPFVNFLGDSLFVCPGDTTLLTLNADPNYIYQWSPATGLSDPNSPNPLAFPTVTTNYTVQVLELSATDSCYRNLSVMVYVPQPTVVALGDDILACDSLVSIQATGAPGAIFQWFDENGNVLQQSQDAVFEYDVNGDAQVFVSAGDPFGCFSSTDSLLINYHVLNVNLSPAAVLCPGDTVTLVGNVDAVPGDVVEWQWEPSGEILSGQNTSTVLVAPSVPTTFTTNVLNQYGCTDTAFASVMVAGAYPLAEAAAAQDSVFPGQQVQLNALLGNGYIYEWAPAGLLDNPLLPNPVATINNDTWFYLTVTNAEGCASLDSVLVLARGVICAEPYIFVPSGFTPDGNGENDLLYVRSNILVEMHWVIYDRWGEKVFETNDLNVGWDGTFRGKELPPDVFGYYLTGRCSNGDTFTKKGNVTLLK